MTDITEEEEAIFKEYCGSIEFSRFHNRIFWHPSIYIQTPIDSTFFRIARVYINTDKNEIAINDKYEDIIFSVPLYDPNGPKIFHKRLKEFIYECAAKSRSNEVLA